MAKKGEVSPRTRQETGRKRALLLHCLLARAQAHCSHCFWWKPYWEVAKEYEEHPVQPNSAPLLWALGPSFAPLLNRATVHHPFQLLTLHPGPSPPWTLCFKDRTSPVAWESQQCLPVSHSGTGASALHPPQGRGGKAQSGVVAGASERQSMRKQPRARQADKPVSCNSWLEKHQAICVPPAFLPP